MAQTQLIFEKQWLHASLLAVLVAGMALVAGCGDVRTGTLWGVATPVWLWLAVGVAIAHQVYVWLCWRTQLHASLLTRAFGSLGFPLYAVGFSVLGIMRVVLVFIVAISNRDTLPGNAIALKVLAVILLAPAAYLFYSVIRYFGFKRASASIISTSGTGPCRSSAGESSGLPATACISMDSSSSGFLPSGGRRRRHSVLRHLITSTYGCITLRPSFLT